MPLTLDLFSVPALSSAFVRASTAADGTQANNHSSASILSADGRFVLFDSAATTLVPGDPGSRYDIFRKDMRTGEIVALSKAIDGAWGNDSSNNPVLSADGRYLVFGSFASNLGGNDTNGKRDIFRKDLVTGGVIRVSEGFPNLQSNDDSASPSISADGRYVAFESYATNLTFDTNGWQDIFVKDCLTGTITLASSGPFSIAANGGSYRPNLSADGRYVVFESDATNLGSGDSNGASDIFRKDLVTGVVVRLSVTEWGNQANGGSYDGKLSADGRYLLFTSRADNLVAGDLNGSSDIFRKDLETGQVIRVSTSAAGAQGNADSSEASFSADGRYVIFSSNASNLVANDTNGRSDVFRKDLATGDIVRISVTENGGQIADNSLSGSLSADGRYASFTTFAPAAASDTNGVPDIHWIDVDHIADLPAMGAGSYVEGRFSVGSASKVSIAWDDGATHFTPVDGHVDFSHIFADTATKTVTVTATEGSLTRDMVYTVDLAAKTMTRASVADTLGGGTGDEVLTGDEGANVLRGGAGQDVFVFETALNKVTNLDRITDFKPEDDAIWLDHVVMPKLGLPTSPAPQKLNKAFFKAGTKAGDRNDYIVYNKGTGYLYYDRDGSGSAKAVPIALLSKGLKLTYEDFFVI